MPIYLRLRKPILWLVFFISFQGWSQTNRQAAGQVWSAERANAWYSQHRWITGANFLPSTAINQLEMWQEESFDPATIDRELGWAEKIGFNSMRVFLHSLAWKEDPEGFKKKS